MPSKIDINRVYEAISDKMRRTGKTQLSIRRDSFTRLVKGASIASSKNAIETLWFQLLDSEINLYTGPCEVAIVDFAGVESMIRPEGPLATHTLSHTSVGVKN